MTWALARLSSSWVNVACVNRSGTRCSDKGFLPISVAAYLELLDVAAIILQTP
jgi:hypothetical protein